MKENAPSQNSPAHQEGGAQELGTSMAPPAFQLKAGSPVVQKRDEKPKGEQEKAPEGENKEAYNTYVSGDVIVTIPKNATGSLSTVVIYGGLLDRGGSKENMKSWTPANYFTSHILVFANYYTGFVKGVKPVVEAASKQYGVSATYKALLGFSQGGVRVAAAKNDASWSVIGMIDPAVSWEADSFPCNVYMVWDTWGKNTLADDPRSKLHNKIKEGKIMGDSKQLKVGHLKMPAAWFAEFGGNL